MDLSHRRSKRAEPFLVGRGLEIGAGMAPQAVPDGCEVLHFDLRDSDELRRYFSTDAIPTGVRPISEIPAFFPDGADFLIAHHVVEHTPDPIGALREWRRLVKPDGVLCISFPNFECCPDRRRLLPSAEHLILDNLLGRNGDDFESREHVLSFLCSWIDDSPGLANMTRSQACHEISLNTHRSGHDFHWHAFDHKLSRLTIEVACLLDGGAPVMLVDPNNDPPDEKAGVVDMHYVYRVEPLSARTLSRHVDAAEALFAARRRLVDAAAQLEWLQLKR